MSNKKKPIFESNILIDENKNSQIFQEKKTRCLYHKDLNLTNFCKDFNCLMPLCPECMKNHLAKHKIEQTYAEIERIDNVLEDSLLIIEKLLNFYKNDLITLQNLEETKNFKTNDIFNKIMQAKEKVLMIVNEFFETFILETNEISKKQQNRFNQELEISKGFVLNKIEEIKKFQSKLKNHDKYVKSIIKLHSTTFYLENFNYHTEIKNYIEIINDKLIWPMTDDSKLYSFNLELAKYICLKNADIFKENLSFLTPPQPKNSYESNFLNNLKEIHKQSPNLNLSSFKDDLLSELENHKKKIINDDKLLDLSFMTKIQDEKRKNQKINPLKNFISLSPIEKEINEEKKPKEEKKIKEENKKRIKFNLDENNEFENNNNHTPIKERKHEKIIPSFSKYEFKNSSNQKSTIKKKLISENIKNYFDESNSNKFLHYFEPNTKSLFLLNLLDINSSSNYFTEVKLKISFQIPENHRSIITPFGEIYILGGSIGSKISNIFLKYDYNQKNLINKQSMLINRKSHGVCYLDNYLYIIGGIGDNDETIDNCEKYDLKNNIWIKLSKTISKSSFFSLITYDNKYIYKIGGVLNNKIERFDTIKNIWNEINCFFENKELVLPSLSSGIQINDREILIFGGLLNYKDIDNSFLIKINGLEGQQCSFYELNEYNLPYECYFNCIPIFQNGNIYVIMETLNKNMKNKKILLRFDGNKWINLY